MKKTLLLALTCLCTLAASAQSAFTVTSPDGKSYSFPIGSTITLTDNEQWKAIQAEFDFTDYQEASTYVTSLLNATTGTYNFSSQAKFAKYAALYLTAATVDTSSFSDDQLTSWTTILTALRKVNTSYGYYTQQLMSERLQGKYLVVAQGSPSQFLCWNKTADLTASTYCNGHTLGPGSGYVAWAKHNVAISDTTVFQKSAAGKTFVTATMMGKPCFGGLDTVDVYVTYNANLDKYTPSYIARKGNFLVEQWKGNTAIYYATLDEALAHLGPNSGNMADRFWLQADYDETAQRIIVVNNAATIDALFQKYSDFTFVGSSKGATAGDLLEEGVTVAYSDGAFTYSKDGETCDFSGVAFLKAKNADGDSHLIIMFLTNNQKYYVYAYALNEDAEE